HPHFHRTASRVLRIAVGRGDTGTGGSTTEYRLIQPVRRTANPHAKSVFMCVTVPSKPTSVQCGSQGLASEEAIVTGGRFAPKPGSHRPSVQFGKVVAPRRCPRQRRARLARARSFA